MLQFIFVKSGILLQFIFVYVKMLLQFIFVSKSENNATIYSCYCKRIATIIFVYVKILLQCINVSEILLQFTFVRVKYSYNLYNIYIC